jgi:predicted dehydrogenase
MSHRKSRQSLSFDVLNIGVIGAGRWGANLLRCFGNVDEARIVAVCDTDPGRLRAPGIAPRARRHPKLADLLHDEAVKAVAIATPAALHAQQAVAALEAGKHVFVEKPMALGLREAQQMRDAALAAGRCLMVGHLLRYHPAIVELERLVKQGRLGRVHHVWALRLGPGATSPDDGPWWALAPHDISVVRSLLRAEILDVSARRRDFADGGSEVTADLRLGTASMTLVTSTAHPRKVRRLALVGTQATALFDDSDGKPLLAVSEGTPPWLDRVSEDALPTWLYGPAPLPDDGWKAVDFNPTEPLICEARHFVSALRHGIRVLTDADEGCRVVAVLEAGALSMSARGATTPVPSVLADTTSHWAEQENQR